MAPRARIARVFGVALLTLVVVGFVAPAALAQSLECPTCTVDDVVEGVNDTVTEVGDTVGGSGGGNDPDPIGEIPGSDTLPDLKPDDDLDDWVDELPQEIGNIIEPKEKKKHKNDAGRDPRTGSHRTGTYDPRLSYFPETGKIGAAFDRESVFGRGATEDPRRKGIEAGGTSFAAPNQMTLEEALRQLGEAAKKLAFPLGLGLAVLAYLMVQGRIDSKDPKLALAAVDSDEEFLSFQ